MLSLPEPTYSFTIPSLHDDLPLDCRVYHPAPDGPIAPSTSSRSRKGAIVAHPYAPLGGSYNDAVVQLVAAEILRQGFIVVTFNFRGAGSSKGRTSWTGKGELGDYMSVTGFLIRYMYELDELFGDEPPVESPYTSSDGLLSPVRAAKPHWRSMLLFAGYSYGSLITSRLPSLSTIISRFNSHNAGSATLEILLRACKLASQWHKEEVKRLHSGTSPQHVRITSTSMVVGGEESESGMRRSSSYSRKRKSFDSIRMRFAASRGGKSRWEGGDEDKHSHGLGGDGTFDLSELMPAYLLVSPLLPPISHFTTLFSGLSVTQRSDEEEQKLVEHDTLAIFGDRDAFTSVKKLRKWAEEFRQRSGGSFAAVEVQGAGHFWNEPGVAEQLRQGIAEWLQRVAGRVDSVDNTS